MRAGNKSLNIRSYAQFHRLDPSKIKIRQTNHLFDVDPSKNNSNKRARTDTQDAIPSSPMDIAAPLLDLASSSNPLCATIGQTAASSRTNPSLNEKRKPKT